MMGLDFDSMSRREALKLGGVGAATAALGVGGTLSVLNQPESDYTGIPEDLTSGQRGQEFSNFVESHYSVEDFDASEHDILVDARYVEGEEFTEEHVEGVEQIFADAGFDLKFLEREEAYPREIFQNRYDPSTEDILGSDDSLYDEWVEDVMQEAAVQMFFVPGRETQYGESIINGEKVDLPENASNMEEGAELGTNGVALHDRAAVGMEEYANQPLEEREGNPELKMYTVAHEIGHTLGLGHTQNPDNLMYDGNLRPGRMPGFSESQIESMEEQLS